MSQAIVFFKTKYSQMTVSSVKRDFSVEFTKTQKNFQHAKAKCKQKMPKLSKSPIKTCSLQQVKGKNSVVL